jgi:hypothetical protein
MKLRVSRECERPPAQIGRFCSSLSHSDRSRRVCFRCVAPSPRVMENISNYNWSLGASQKCGRCGCWRGMRYAADAPRRSIAQFCRRQNAAFMEFTRTPHERSRFDDSRQAGVLHKRAMCAAVNFLVAHRNQCII